MSATLYAVHSSHPAHAARLMLEHKGIEHKVVNLVPGTHAAVLRPLGFRNGTVPALRLDGRCVQGSRAISRALEEGQSEPPLFPADPQERIQIEEAELWGDEVLQPVPRRLAAWITVYRPGLRTQLAREAGAPAPGLLGLAGRPAGGLVLRAQGRGRRHRGREEDGRDAARPARPCRGAARRGDDRWQAAQRGRLPDRDLGPAAE